MCIPIHTDPSWVMSKVSLYLSDIFRSLWPMSAPMSALFRSTCNSWCHVTSEESLPCLDGSHDLTTGSDRRCFSYAAIMFILVLTLVWQHGELIFAKPQGFGRLAPFLKLRQNWRKDPEICWCVFFRCAMYHCASCIHGTSSHRMGAVNQLISISLGLWIN